MSELEIWNELGNIYYNAGAYDEAIRAYHRAIELEHGSGQCFSNLADIYIRKGNHADAILMYQKGIQLLKSPADRASLWKRLGNVYLQLDRYGEATQAYQTAVDLDPDDLELQDELAKMNFVAAHAPLAEDPPAEVPVQGDGTPIVDAVSEPALDEPVLTNTILEEVAAEIDMADVAPQIEATAPVEAILPEVDPILEASAPIQSQPVRVEPDVEAITSAPVSCAELVDETELDTCPPLPAEFRDEDSLDIEAFSARPVVLENEMEAEAALRIAGFLADLPDADPAEPEFDSACWIFHDQPAEVEVQAIGNEPAERTPVILGGGLLSRLDELEDVTAVEENEPAPVIDEAPTAIHVPPFLEMDEPPAEIQEQAQELQEVVSDKGDEILSFLNEPQEAEPSEPLADVEDNAGVTETAPRYTSIEGILAEALPQDFEIPFHQTRSEIHLPAIEPHMGEPMNSRASALVRLGLRRWHQEDYEGAVQFLKTALNLAGVFFDHPFEGLCYHALGVVEADMGHIEPALTAFENAATLDPEHIFPWKDMGSLYSQCGRYEEALEAFKKAIEHTPNDPLSWNGLGDVYHKLGRAEDAISAYQLGNVFDRQHREFAATEAVLPPFEPGSHNPHVLEEMGNLYFLHSEFDEAIHAYSDAIDLLESPAEQARLWRRLGDAYQRLNENDNAKAAYQQAFNLDRGILPTRESTSEASVESSASEKQDAHAEETSPEEEYGLPETEPVIAFEAEPEPAIAAEPEAAYWFFKDSPAEKPAADPVREPAPSTEGGRFSTDGQLGAVRPSPAFVLPKYSNQARLDKPLMMNAYEDADVLVLEETPEPEAKVLPAPVVVPAIAEEETRPFTMAELQSDRMTEQELDEMEGREFEAAASETATEEPAKPDAHTLENDIAAYRKVTEINPLNDRAWDALGNMYEATGLHSEAIAAFEKAISLASQREVYHYHLGLAHAAQKHYDRAIQSLQKVVALNPEYVLAHCALAGYYRRMGKDAEAREHTTFARPFMEKENYYNQACFESICGNTDRAFSLLKSALENQQVDVELARSDPDLDFIREDTRFEQLLGR